jgi:hypothetical protein
VNRWEKAISAIDDNGMKKILGTVIALKKRYGFWYQLSNLSGFTDAENGKITATAELLEIFVKREIRERMKKRAAEKAAKKESEDGQK